MINQLLCACNEIHLPKIFKMDFHRNGNLAFISVFATLHPSNERTNAPQRRHNVSLIQKQRMDDKN